MSIRTHWLNQPEQVRYRARLPLISVESLPIPSMIPMIRSTTPDVLFVHIRLARRCHGWTVLASSRPAIHLRPFRHAEDGRWGLLRAPPSWTGRKCVSPKPSEHRIDDPLGRPSLTQRPWLLGTVHASHDGRIRTVTRTCSPILLHDHSQSSMSL